MIRRPTSQSPARYAWSSGRVLEWRERVRARLEALSPRQRQYALLAVLLAGGIALLWVVFSLSNPAQEARTVDATAQGGTSVTNVGVLPPGAPLNPVDQWVGTAGRKLAQYESEREEQGRLNKERQSFESRTMQRFAELEQRLTSAQQGAVSSAPVTASPSVSQPAQHVQPLQPLHPLPPDELAQPARAQQFPPPPQTLPPRPLPPRYGVPARLPQSPFPPTSSVGATRPVAPSAAALGYPSDMPPGVPSDVSPDIRTDTTSFATTSSAPVISRVSVGAEPARSTARDDALEQGTPQPNHGDPATANVTGSSTVASHEARTVATFLPVSFTRGTLLGGLDAPTGGQSQSNPQPVLIQLSDNSVLPNQFRGEYRDCFVVAAGYGDISSERAYLRTENLSCVRADGATLEVRIQGTVYGEDGKVGMRGRLVTKQGQMLANALLAGVVSGIGQGLSTANTSYSSSPLGTTASTDSSADAYRAGIGSGVGKALDRLAQYYIKLAENTFPVIEVDAGREIDVVVTRGVRIDVPISGNPSVPPSVPATPDVNGRTSVNEPRGPLSPSRRFPSPETRYLGAIQDERY